MNNLNLTDDTKIRISIIAKYFPKGRDNALHQKEIADIHDIEPQDVKELAKKETVHTEFVDITGLGIIELTRNKNDKSLKEILQNSNQSVDNIENE